MKGIEITCDRQDGISRAAVWKDGELVDLHLANDEKFDLTGAIVGGKAARLMPRMNAAFFECGLDDPVFVENVSGLRSGEYRVLRISSAKRQGKAWGGELSHISRDDKKTGILVEAYSPWRRAIEDLKDKKIAAISFSDGEAYAECREWIDCCAQKLLPILRPLEKKAVHAELDEILEGLKTPRVYLSDGGNLVVEETEALVAIDVNSGDRGGALATNMLAVKEAARQIRLRNLAGTIVIDALKMKNREDKAKILKASEKAVEDDPANAKVAGITKLGLIEITRKRRGFSLSEVFGNE